MSLAWTVKEPARRISDPVAPNCLVGSPSRGAKTLLCSRRTPSQGTGTDSSDYDLSSGSERSSCSLSGNFDEWLERLRISPDQSAPTPLEDYFSCSAPSHTKTASATAITPEHSESDALIELLCEKYKMSLVEEQRQGRSVTVIEFDDSYMTLPHVPTDLGMSQSNLDQVQKRPAGLTYPPTVQRLALNQFSPLVEWMVRQNQTFMISPHVELERLASILQPRQLLFAVPGLSHPIAHVLTETRTILLCPNLDNILMHMSKKDLNTNELRKNYTVPEEHTLSRGKELNHAIQEMIPLVNELVVQESPLMAQLYFLLARSYFEMDDVDSARSTLRQSSDICAQVFSEQSEEYAITFWFGSILESKNDPSLAREMRNVFYLRLGIIRLEQGNAGRARDLLTRGSQNAPACGHYHAITTQTSYFLALAYVKYSLPENGAQILKGLFGELKKPFHNEHLVYSSVECSYRNPDLIVPVFPHCINICNILELLSDALLASGDLIGGVEAMYSLASKSLYLAGYSASVLAEVLSKLGKIYENRGADPRGTSPLCDIADAVRMYLASAVVHRSLGETNASEVYNMVSKSSALICSRLPSVSNDLVNDRLRDLIAAVPEEGALLDPSIRYSFVHFMYPPQERKLASLETIQGAPTKTDTLVKRGQRRHTWKVRYFELRNQMFTYYPDVGGAPLRHLSVSEIEDLGRMPSFVSSKTGFFAQWPRHTLYISCPAEKADEWIQVLTEARIWWAYRLPVPALTQ